MANIDDELAFLRDAKDSDGNLAREAIANALTIINEDRAYHSNVLNARENGEYETDNPWGKVIVNTDDSDPLIDGIAPRFEITKNGLYYSKELFQGKDMLITEFDVNVPESTTTVSPLTVTQNGTYEITDEDVAFGTVTVNVENAKNPGDYLIAAMYFLDPSNPNDASMIFIDEYDHILFGDSARQLLDRFPKFKTIKKNSWVYVHDDWNPDPNRLTADQIFIPDWIKMPEDLYIPDPNKAVDYDIFKYIINHKILDLFYDEEDDIIIYINNNPITIKYHGRGFTDVDGNVLNYCFYISAYDSQASQNYANPVFCSNDTSNIDMLHPIDGNNFYWWGCSLARAQINHDRSILLRQSDIDIYDSCNWDVTHILPQTLINDIKPVTHYVTHLKQVEQNSPFRFKTIPRKNLSIVEGDDTYEKVEEPSGNPHEQGWYNYNAEFKTFSLTADTSVRPDVSYFFKRNSYTISVDSPTITDQYDVTQFTGWSDYELNLKHSPILYIQQVNGQYKAYKKISEEYVEYTIDEHIKYINAHPTNYEAANNVVAYYSTMLGVSRRIYDIEHPTQTVPMFMEDIYNINKYSCVYLYDKTAKIYYTFNPTKITEQEAYNSVSRFTLESNPDVISQIDEAILNKTYTHMYEIHYYEDSIEHPYNKEFDIWPDERYLVYARGNYFERFSELHVDENGNPYDVTFYYRIINNNNISAFHFFNYDDIVNGFNTCLPCYHFVNSNGVFSIERVNTQYNGYISETVEYCNSYSYEKVSDKFLLSANDETVEKNYILAPPYYAAAHVDKETYVRSTLNNLINTPLIEYLENVTNASGGIGHNKDIICDKVVPNIYRNGLNTFLNNVELYNSNRNIFADEMTIKDFEDRAYDNMMHPNIYPLYNYEEASAIWQKCYDEYEVYYGMMGPHNSYNKNGSVMIYEYLYFFL